MSDGHRVPGVPDGQAFFPHPDDPDLLAVVYWYELEDVGTALGNRARAYDPVAQAGNTIYDIEPDTMTVVNSFIVSSGTDNNCSGGATPRNTWLTCEENVVGPREALHQEARLCVRDPLAGVAADHPQADPPDGPVLCTRPRSTIPPPASST